MATKAEVIKDQRWNYLVLTGNSESRNAKTYVECRCDCGAINWHNFSSIRRGRIKSCGCARKERWLKQVKRKGSDSPFWRGHGEISANVWGSYVDGAQRRNIDFTLTIEEAWNVYLEQDRKCAITGLEIGFAPSLKEYTDKTASLDRIDPKGIYVRSNIQWVHKTINIMRLDMTVDDFYLWCERALLHRDTIKLVSKTRHLLQ